MRFTSLCWRNKLSIPNQKSLINDYSERLARLRFNELVRKAYSQIPYYRESSGCAQELIIPNPLLNPEKVIQHYFRLFPFSRPLKTEVEFYYSENQGKELLEALLLTGQYSPITALFEVRKALLDERFLGPLRLGKRYVLLSNTAFTHPLLDQETITLPKGEVDDRHLLRTTRSFYLLGSRAEVTFWLNEFLDYKKGGERLSPALPSGLFIRHDYGGSGDNEGIFNDSFEISCAPVLKQRADNLLFESNLNYLGAYVPECHQYHLNWKRFHAQNTEQGVVYSKLEQLRPAIIHYLPARSSFTRVDSCPIHGSPILVPKQGAF